MLHPSQRNSTDESDANDTNVLNALKDLDGIESEIELDIAKLNFSSDHPKILKNDVSELKKKSENDSGKSLLKSKSVENHSNESKSTSNSTYCDVSTPPMDSKSNSALRKSTAASKTNKIDETDVSYSPDFTEDTDKSMHEMTAWEKWFVMKQIQIRQRAELEKEKKMMEEKKLQELRQKKAEDNERKQKLWLEQKRLENKMKKEKDAESKENNKRSTDSHGDNRFEKWYLKKLQERKSQVQYNQQLQKYEELQKEMRRKKNEKAQIEWMNKAKQRPITPRITYAYVGDSVIGFYDSTSHPPPTYINPIPWQS
ncbi:coiled-coil domain-containing protein 34-like [Hetaerina americana]|uniref:coiled-coil domain-containing protein 34-like n=1 Tax=Hetaerina americana TaxID=62018 RepID=UPI003A7F24F5